MKINKILIPAACSLIIAIALYPIFNPGIRRTLTLSGFRKAAESMSIIAQEWENAGYDYMFTDRKMYETDTIAVGYRTDDTVPVGANKNHFRYILTEKKYQYIMKEGNAVYFTKYSSLGNGYGVAFVADDTKPQDEFIKSCEKIDGYDKWYFYVME